MNRVRLAALLFVLVTSAGCTAIFPGDVDQGSLEEDVEYDWDTTANVTVTAEQGRYEAVYTFENRSTIELYQIERFNNERPFDPIGPKFRYPNGTVVGPEAMSFEKSRSSVTVELPAREGQFAYSAPRQGKEVRLAVLVEDASYEVVLPENARVQYPLLGRVVPRGYETETVDGHVHVRWPTGEVTSDQVIVQYYLVRDLYLFGGLFVLGVIAAVAVVAYFWLQLRSARQRREEVGLDVESGDDR